MDTTTAQDRANDDYHLGCEPMWEYDPTGWGALSDDQQADYSAEWYRLEDR